MKTLIEVFYEIGTFPFQIVYTDPFTLVGYTHVVVSRGFIPNHSGQVFKSDKGDYFANNLPCKLTSIHKTINFKFDASRPYDEIDCTCPARHNLFAFGHVNTCEYKRNV